MGPIVVSGGGGPKSKKSDATKSVSTGRPQLNPDSHHVRTTNEAALERLEQEQRQARQKKKKMADSRRKAIDDSMEDSSGCGGDDYLSTWDSRQQHGVDDMAYLEKRLVESIQLDERMSITVNKRITDALEQGLMRVPVTAFILISNGGGCQFIDDFRTQLCTKYEVELPGKPVSLKQADLSLDMYHYDAEYRRVIAIILYLESLKLRMKCVISRQAIAITPHALEIFPPDPPIEGNNDNTGTTTAITTTTHSNSDTTTTTTRIIHNNSNNNVVPDSRMVIPVIQTSAFDRFMYNCMRLRQTGFYYMLYVDLPLSIGGKGRATITTKNDTKTNSNS